MRRKEHHRNGDGLTYEVMTRQMLKGIRVQSKQELEERIYRYFDEVNETPVVNNEDEKPDNT